MCPYTVEDDDSADTRTPFNSYFPYACYRVLNDHGVDAIPPDEDMDYIDTFLDEKHLLSSFPNALISFVSNDGPPPYKLSITRGKNDQKDRILVTPYLKPRRGPYPSENRRGNFTRFTPSQIEALRSGLNEGLTVIQGPPGTGKSDTAVQIAAALYHNYPKQRILLITHSNAALNDLFIKIKEVENCRIINIELMKTAKYPSAASSSAWWRRKGNHTSRHTCRNRIPLL